MTRLMAFGMALSPDKGIIAAAAMRGGIDRLKAGISRSGARTAYVKNAGIEVSAQELALAEAHSRLTLARTEIHTSDAARVDSVIQEGLKILTSVDVAGDQALAELRYRRRGLAVSLGAILLVVVALALKIRQLDRQSLASPESRIGH
jgi:hypothetical protein